jgi:hypothetical protein
MVTGNRSGERLPLQLVQIILDLNIWAAMVELLCLSVLQLILQDRSLSSEVIDCRMERDHFLSLFLSLLKSSSCLLLLCVSILR